MLVKDKIKQLEETIVQHQLEVDILREISERYSDLEININRWKKEFYSSSQVNHEAVDCYFGHSCGCCNDSPLYVYPYVYYKGVRVFANPFQICIGEKNGYGFGERDYDNWREEVAQHNLNEVIVKK